MANNDPLGHRHVARFVLNGQVVTLKGIDPTRTVLQYLREDARCIGTKEGCAEGDCGACTVVLAELDAEDQIRFRAINSCIQFLPTLDGKQLITVENLRQMNGDLHPVQQAMVDCHGSQCGFCTPGFVMSLFALYKTKDSPTRREIDDALAGNLCRCTGYRPIIEAAQVMYEYGRDLDSQGWLDKPFAIEDVNTEKQQTIQTLKSIQPNDTLALTFDNKRYFAPTSLKDLVKLVHENPTAHILAGGTDIGLWVTKHYQCLETVIYLGNITELKQINVTDEYLEIGAGVTLSDAMPPLLDIYPELEELFLRFASPPIRNAGTLGGNIANGSPIGDSMPVLITLGTILVFNAHGTIREIPLDEFYIEYQKNQRQPGEILQAIRIPTRIANCALRSYKISKRFDQDISAVCGAFRLELDGENVCGIDIAYGGVAEIPKRATHCEDALVNREWTESCVHEAMEILEQDFQPITDMRASDIYRKQVAKNLLYKFFLDTTGVEQLTGIYDYGR